jgi:hypothetical protein
MKQILSIACLFLLTLSACKVEGPQGPAGADGADGNANVKTQIITVTPTNWTGNGFVLEAKKLASVITADIVNSGAVLVYLQTGNGTFIPVPVSNTNYWVGEDGNPVLYNSHIFYQYSASNITFYLQDDDAQTEPPSANMVFKVVAIASSEVVAGMNTKDYIEVSTALGI